MDGARVQVDPEIAAVDQLGHDQVGQLAAERTLAGAGETAVQVAGARQLPVEEHGLCQRRLDSAENNDHVDRRLPAFEQPLVYRLQPGGFITVGQGHQHPGAAGIATGQVNRGRSRQRLQEDRHITQIRKWLTRKVLDSLADIKKEDEEKYLEFWKPFGKAIKEGLSSDFDNKDKILPLVLFESSQDPEKLTTLAEYVERMP